MSLGRKLAVVAAVYVVEGFPMGVFGDLWPVYWVDAGLGDASIGALSGLGLAWAAKALWSPLVGRWPGYRAWMAGALGVMAAALLAMPAIDPVGAPALVTAAVATFCLASATQDIAIDAYTIGFVARGEEGPANGVRISAYRAGALLSGAGLFFLPAQVGWGGTHVAAAALALLLLAVPARVPAVGLAAVPAAGDPPAARPSARMALRRLLLRPGAAAALAFVLLFRLADFAAGPMMKPFFRRSGVSLEAIGVVATGVGTAGVLLGAALGGWLVSRLGIARALAATGVAALASNLGYAAAALAPEAHAGLYLASAVESFCTGLAVAAFMSFLMRICDREYAAVQYAVLTGLYALVGRGLGMASGVAAEELGYAAFFAATALLGLPGLALLPAAAGWLRSR